MKNLYRITLTVVSWALALPAWADVVDPLTPFEAVTEDPDLMLITALAVGLFGLLFISGLALVIIIGIIIYRRKQRAGKPHP